MIWFTQHDREHAREQQIRASLSSNNQLIYAGSLLHRAAQLFPHRCAIIVPPDEYYTYERLNKHASQISHMLEQHGLVPRMRVALLMENSYLFSVAYHAAWQAGAVVIPLNVFLHEQELIHIIQESQPHILIISASLVHKVDTIRDHIPQYITDQELNEILHTTTKQPLYQVKTLAAEEPSVILYTSGTTGMPKGVVLTSFAIMSNVTQALTRFAFTPDERVLCALPLFHSFTQNTCIWSSTACGATVIIVPKIMRSALLAGIACNPTIVIGIPGLFALFCRMHNITFPTVRYFISGGDALPHNIRRFFALRFGRVLCNGYGLTEAGPIISAFLDDYIMPTHTVGPPVINLSIDIRDVTDGIGTLWISGPNLMDRYYHAPEATAAVMRQGWLNTGDLVTRDNFGNISICGREKDLIVHKGIKIYPQEIETVLSNHPRVFASAIIGITDPEDGEYPVAYVQPLDAQQLDTEELRTFCTQYLASYKIPKKFFVLEQLPLTSTGKIDKKALRATYTPLYKNKESR